MYSLVNIAVVVRDLSRHPQGAALADDLLHVLALDDPALAELDALPASPGSVEHRVALLDVVTHESSALRVLATARAAAESSGFAAWSASLGLLEAAPMGGWPELSRWVSDELLGAAWTRSGDLAVARRPHALRVVDDGLLAAYAEAGPEHPLARPWRHWVGRHAAPLVDQPAVARLVAMVAAASLSSLDAAGDAMRQARAEGWSWPLSMHDACWAIELTGRTRSAAGAQLHALRALLGGRRHPPRPDLVAAVVAAVHATVAADLLAAETVAAMCRPLLAHLDVA
jgi:hypothetical protein